MLDFVALKVAIQPQPGGDLGGARLLELGRQTFELARVELVERFQLLDHPASRVIGCMGGNAWASFNESVASIADDVGRVLCRQGRCVRR